MVTPTPEPLTDERLAAIEARCAAARTSAPDCACGSFALQYDGCRCEMARWEACLRNAEAAALADVPDLVTEVRRLRAFIEGLMGDECTAFDNYLTGGPGSCPESDWPRDQWCLHCRSRVALAGHMEVGTG